MDTYWQLKTDLEMNAPKKKNTTLFYLIVWEKQYLW